MSADTSISPSKGASIRASPLFPTSPPDGADPAEFSEATGCTKMSDRENPMLLHKMFNRKVRGLAGLEGRADGCSACDAISEKSRKLADAALT